MNEPPAATVTALTDALLTMAQRMIRQQRQFYPFGGVVAADGDVEVVAGEGANPWSGSDELRDGLRESLSARVSGDDDLVAFAVATHTAAGIEVDVHHRGAPPLRVTQPFTRKRFSKQVEFGPPTIGPPHSGPGASAGRGEPSA